MPSTPASTQRPVVITIDGPAGTGKSTVGHLLAHRLGLEFLDTGAMYRAAAVVAIEQNLDPADGAALASAVSDIDLHFDWDGQPPPLMLGERDLSERIRAQDVSRVVSIVAAEPEVRQVLVAQQRRIADRHPRLVTEGRDQGSVVFPDAALRFYLDADVTVRATRRAQQLARAGRPVDQDRVIHDIQERDRIDSTRPDGPLIRPEGAVDVDTSHRTLEQVVEVLESIARDKLPDAGFRP
jgi:cytidylate kinase